MTFKRTAISRRKLSFLRRYHAIRSRRAVLYLYNDHKVLLAWELLACLQAASSVYHHWKGHCAGWLAGLSLTYRRVLPATVTCQVHSLSRKPWKLLAGKALNYQIKISVSFSNKHRQTTRECLHQPDRVIWCPSWCLDILFQERAGYAAFFSSFATRGPSP